MAAKEGKPRQQLCLRFDNRPRLLEQVKARCAELNIKLIDYIASSLENSLRTGFNPADCKTLANDKAQALEAKIEALEARLTEVEQKIAEGGNDNVPYPTAPPITDSVPVTTTPPTADNSPLRTTPPTADTKHQNYQAIRDRILKNWRISKRAESRERIAEVLDKFIAELSKLD